MAKSSFNKPIDAQEVWCIVRAMLGVSRNVVASFRPRISFVALFIAIALFLILGQWLAASLPSWSEEISVFPSAGYRIVSATQDGHVSFAPSCSDLNAPSFVTSPSRPVYSACIAGKTFPVMISSYASGIPYWPTELFSALHDHDIFALRYFGLILGVLGILGAFLLVRRLVDEVSAICCALVLACHSAYVHTHVLAMYYEAVPWLALTMGALGWLRWNHDSTAKRRHFAILAPSVGLMIAFMANIKTILVLAPLGLLALRGYRQWPKLSRGQWLVVFVCILLAFVPLATFATIDPSGGLSRQFSSRGSHFFAHFGPKVVILEFYSTLIFGTDMGFYGDMVMDRPTAMWWPAVVCMALALIYPTYSLVRVLRRGEGSWFAAFCAAEIWTFLFVSAFLYGQFPSANYAPVNPAFGLCIGLSLGALAKHIRPPMFAILVAAIMGTFGWNLVRRGDYRGYYDTSINATAERNTARFLREHANDGLLVLTTTYNLAGVFESLGAGIVHPVQIEPFVAQSCTSNDRVDEVCLEQHWNTLFDEQRLPRPWRVVLPAVESRVDEQAAKKMERTLRKAAERRHISVETEREFTTLNGVTVLRVVRVAPDEP